jgi:hypothetical protein
MYIKSHHVENNLNSMKQDNKVENMAVSINDTVSLDDIILRSTYIKLWVTDLIFSAACAYIPAE